MEIYHQLLITMNRKRFTVLLLSSALASASLVGCNDDSSVSLGDPIPTAPTKKYGPDCDPSAASQTIRFIHVADLHGHFGYREQFYSKIKQAHLSALDENAYTLFTNGGDDYEKGTVAEQLSGGYATLEATQALAFDYRVIGNHDFAWGPEQLLEYSRDDVAPCSRQILPTMEMMQKALTVSTLQLQRWAVLRSDFSA